MTLTHAFAGGDELPEMGKDRTVSICTGQAVAVTRAYLVTSVGQVT